MEPMSDQFFKERVGEGLDSELERPEIGALFESLHFTGHEGLMDWFTLRVFHIQIGA